MKRTVLLFVIIIALSCSYITGNNASANEEVSDDTRYINYYDLLDNDFMTNVIEDAINNPTTILEDGSRVGERWYYNIEDENGNLTKTYYISLVIQEIETNRFLYTPNDTDIRDSVWVIMGAYIQNITDGGEEIFCIDYNEEIKEDWSRKNQQLYPNGDYIQELDKPSASLRYNCHSYAWYSQGQLNNVWMNSPEIYYSSNDGSYRALGVDEEPRIGDLVVYMKESNYPNHSGIISGYSDDTDNGILGNVNRYMVDSKWGKAGLYKHKGDYCPYYTSATSIVYFRLNTNDQAVISDSNDFNRNNIIIQAKSSAVSRDQTVYACELNFTYSGNHNITITSDVALDTTLWNVWRENYGLTCNEVINEEGQYIYTYSGLFDAGYYYLRAECASEDDSANISVSVSQHEHAYINYTDLGDGTHKLSCDCSVFSVENHEYECSDDENGTSHTYTCSCGISMSEEHNYELVSKNGTYHTYACSCGSSFTNAHTYVKSNYSSTQHKMTCSCGDIKYGDHDYCTYTDYNSSKHKSSCDCGAYIYQLHVIKSDSGIGRYRPCTFCGRMIDTEDGGIKIPIIHNKFENEESE